MNDPRLSKAEWAEEGRLLNAALDAKIVAAGASDASRTEEIKRLAKLEGELEARLPAMQIQAVESDDLSAAFQTAKGRLEAIRARITSLQGKSEENVTLADAGRLVMSIFYHYHDTLPVVLDEYFRRIEPVYDHRITMVKLCSAMQALGGIRDTWLYGPDKSATLVNRHHLNGIIRRATAGACHLLQDCETTPAEAQKL